MCVGCNCHFKSCPKLQPPLAAFLIISLLSVPPVTTSEATIVPALGLLAT